MAVAKQPHLIEKALHELRTVPADRMIRLPWQSDQCWNVSARPGATVALANGWAGIGKTSGGRFKFYYGDHVGNPLFSIWSAWFSIWVTVPLFWLIYNFGVSGQTNQTANVLGFAIGLLTFALFAGRAGHWKKANAIYYATGVRSQGAMWVAVIATLVGCSAMIGSGIRLFEGALPFSMSFSFDTSLLRWFVSPFTEPDKIQSVKGFALLVSFMLFSLWPVVAYRVAAFIFEASSIGWMNRFIITSCSSAAGVPHDVYYGSGSDQFDGRSGNTGALALLPNAAIYLFFALLWLYY